MGQEPILCAKARHDVIPSSEQVLRLIFNKIATFTYKVFADFFFLQISLPRNWRHHSWGAASYWVFSKCFVSGGSFRLQKRWSDRQDPPPSASSAGVLSLPEPSVKAKGKWRSRYWRSFVIFVLQLIIKLYLLYRFYIACSTHHTSFLEDPGKCSIPHIGSKHFRFKHRCLVQW